MNLIRNPVPWANGARSAACFTLDMDAESLLYLAHPQTAHSMASAASMLRYGPDVAVPRILDTYRHYAILHEHPNEQTDADERYWLRRSLSAVKSVTGERSAGWRAPLYRFSHRSAEFLLEEGVAYAAARADQDAQP
jgi:hypothetical protein